MRLALPILLLAPWAEGQPVRPYEAAQWTVPATELDGCVQAALQARGLQPAYPCSDEVFLRRAYVDVIGTLPEPDALRAFLADRRPEKRAELTEALLLRDEFADYWALKWCDLLRVKAEFPINLWPNAVQAYHRWIQDSLRANKPYDQFARELLTSSGSNFREPPVNFYRAVQSRDPATLASAAALTFMGTRLERWPEADRAHLAAFFSRVAYKKTGEWKEEIIYLDPAAVTPLDVVFPDGTKARLPASQDPRTAFADWLIRPDNPWFARSIVNRVWSWLMGRGIVHEPDDLRPDNPPANPELLGYLEREFVGSRYDLRHLYRLILNSQTYQQSSVPRCDPAQAAAHFACYPVRRLDAEVLIDALCRITGTQESYSSPIPEPFTYVPEEQRSIELADGSITSQFLELFGRPARDTGLESERNNEPSDAQRLHLLNSSHIQQKIERSWRLKGVARLAGPNPRLAIASMYAVILCRYPTPEEAATAQQYLQVGVARPQDAMADLAWALINSKEFLYRH